MLCCEVRKKMLLYLRKCLIFSEVCQNDKYRLMWCVDLHYLQPQLLSLHFFYGSLGHPKATVLWVTLFSPTVTPSSLSQLSGNLTSSRSCSCRTSQHCWLPQKLETYFLAFKVWNQDVKISARHSSSSGKNLPKTAGRYRNYCTSWRSIQSPLWQGISSPNSCGRISSSCQWLTWLRWASLNWSKLLGNTRRALGNGGTNQESLGESCLHFLNEIQAKNFQHNQYLSETFVPQKISKFLRMDFLDLQ